VIYFENPMTAPKIHAKGGVKEKTPEQVTTLNDEHQRRSRYKKTNLGSRRELDYWGQNIHLEGQKKGEKKGWYPRTGRLPL